MSKSLRLFALSAALLAACAGARADSASSSEMETGSAAFPGRTGRYVFEVTRDGKPIGTQSVDVTQDGSSVTAVTESKIAVRLLGVVVYRFHQVITERFEGTRMVALHAETRDPEGLRTIDLARDDRDHWSGSIDRKPQSFDCDCQTSTMWQAASMAGSRIIEASQGRPQSITVEDRGDETLNLPEGPVEARHFAVKGGIERDVWFDPAGNLVAAEQVGRDGSLIRQNLISDPAGSLKTVPEAAQP